MEYYWASVSHRKRNNNNTIHHVHFRQSILTVVIFLRFDFCFVSSILGVCFFYCLVQRRRLCQQWMIDLKQNRMDKTQCLYLPQWKCKYTEWSMKWKKSKNPKTMATATAARAAQITITLCMGDAFMLCNQMSLQNLDEPSF